MTADEVLLRKPTPKPPPKQPPPPLVKEPGPLTKIINWYKRGRVVPYATIRDANRSGADTFEEIAPKPVAEIGIKFRF